MWVCAMVKYLFIEAFGQEAVPALSGFVRIPPKGRSRQALASAYQHRLQKLRVCLLPGATFVRGHDGGPLTFPSGALKVGHPGPSPTESQIIRSRPLLISAGCLAWLYAASDATSDNRRFYRLAPGKQRAACLLLESARFFIRQSVPASNIV